MNGSLDDRVGPARAVVLLGGLWLVWILFARRDARRLLAIAELAANGDLQRARAIAERWGEGL